MTGTPATFFGFAGAGARERAIRVAYLKSTKNINAADT
jgi:hypothetical protein